MTAKKPAAKAARKTITAKAIDIGTTDQSLLVGTIADDGSQRLSDSEMYYYLYKKHPWIRACVRIIANAVSQEGYAVCTVDGDSVEDDDSRVKLLHAALANAVRPKTFRQALKAVATDVEIFGWAFWRKKYTGSLLTNLERLDPRVVEPKLTPDRTAIEKYVIKKSRLSNSGVLVQTGGKDEEIPADEVILFSLDEGGDVVLGSPSPLEALDLTTAMDLNIRKFRNNFFKNGAAFGNIFVNKDADEDAFMAGIKAIKSMYTGVGNAHKTVALSGDWDVKSLLQSGKYEVDFVKSTDIVRDEICAVYSVPVSKLMNVSGAMGQAGKGEDDETFEQECVLPLEELLYETISREVIQDGWEMTDLQIVPKRRNKIHPERFDSAIKIVQFGGSANQALDFVGLPKVDDPAMDKPLFLKAASGNVAMDEIPEPGAQNPSGTAAQANAQMEQQAEDEVGQKARKRFPY